MTRQQEIIVFLITGALVHSEEMTREEALEYVRTHRRFPYRNVCGYLILLCALLVPTLSAQTCTATFPFTDTFKGTGALSVCWKPVVGPAVSAAAVKASGLAVPATAKGYGVEMLNGISAGGATVGVQAKVNFVTGTFPALTLDQDATGGAIALEPSVAAIYDLVANSGNYPGRMLCQGDQPKTGDVLSFYKTGSTYTAKNVTSGKIICAVTNSAHTGVPGFQVDARSGGASSVGPVTIQNLASCKLPTFDPASPIPTAPAKNCALADGAIPLADAGASIDLVESAAPVFVQYCEGINCNAPVQLFTGPFTVGSGTFLGSTPAAVSNGPGQVYAILGEREFTISQSGATRTIPAK